MHLTHALMQYVLIVLITSESDIQIVNFILIL